MGPNVAQSLFLEIKFIRRLPTCICLHIVCISLHAMMAELCDCHRILRLKAENVYSLALY